MGRRIAEQTDMKMVRSGWVRMFLHWKRTMRRMNARIRTGVGTRFQREGFIVELRDRYTVQVSLVMSGVSTNSLGKWALTSGHADTLPSQRRIPVVACDDKRVAGEA